MNTVLEVKDLSVALKVGNNTKQILSNIDFTVDKGQCLGILGQSGSGKSMTAKSMLGLLDRNFTVTGSAVYKEKELIGESKESLRDIRGKEIAMVLQNPMTCFDPLCRIGSQILETFQAHTDWDASKQQAKALELLERMRIHDPLEVMEKHPHQLSGGMLQRIMIGIAMIMEPSLLIADEPTTAIDAINQYSIMEEFKNIKNEYNTAMIFITHDLGAIAKIADEVLVLNQGRIADKGSLHGILHHAADPYTRLLIENRAAVMERYLNALYKEKLRYA